MVNKKDTSSITQDHSFNDSDASAHQTVDVPQIDNDNQRNQSNRRKFLGQAGAAGLFAAGLFGATEMFAKNATALAQTACAGACELDPLTGSARADESRRRRYAAADYERNMPIPTHPCNGDEKLYASQRFFASYTKGLMRAAGADGSTFGEVSPSVYCALLNAIATGNPNDFEAVTLGYSNNCTQVAFSEEASRLSAILEPNLQRRLESPQAGYNFDLEGKDYYQLINRSNTTTAFPPAYTFASPEEAVEIIENYWQALTRDVAFINYSSNSLVQAASTDLTQFIQYYKGPVTGDFLPPRVTPDLYSRGILPGDTKGSFISQFLLRDVPYGAQTIDARVQTPTTRKVGNIPVNDFMTTPAEWLLIQTGQTPNRQIEFETTPRYIRSARNLDAFVRNDAIFQAYLNAALILMTPVAKSGDDLKGLGVPVNPNNPYRPNVSGGYCKQLNFVEFGPSQLLSLLGEVSVRAHKAVWYQKWQVHRRLRPEEFGGRVHFTLKNQRIYPINNLVKNSNVISSVGSIYGGNYFLPQAFPEGSPLHPAYGQGHATLAGACVTILKAWFDSEQPYGNFSKFIQASADGLSRVSFTPSQTTTIAEELNKLASNIGIARNTAGVHWRSDYTESVFLGEQVAIQLLRDYGFTYNEDFLGFTFRDFSGNMVTIGEKRLS